MLTRKDRRHSGRVTPQPTIPIRTIQEEGLFLDPYYDDWNNYRDGFRDWYRDFKKIKVIPQLRKTNPEASVMRERMNQKQRKLIRRRRQK